LGDHSLKSNYSRVLPAAFTEATGAFQVFSGYFVEGLLEDGYQLGILFLFARQVVLRQADRLRK
jgi:hypothetical protein